MSKKQDKVDNGIVAVKSKVGVHVVSSVVDNMEYGGHLQDCALFKLFYSLTPTLSDSP